MNVGISNVRRSSRLKEKTVENSKESLISVKERSKNIRNTANQSDGILKGTKSLRTIKTPKKNKIKDIKGTICDTKDLLIDSQLSKQSRISRGITRELKESVKEESSSSGSEDEWEDVDDGEENSTVTTSQSIELVIEGKKSEESKWAKFLRQEVNRKIKERQINSHKVHLLCYIAHLRYLIKTLTGSEYLSSLCLSMIPDAYVSLSEIKFDESVAERFLRWFKSTFIPSEKNYIGINESSLEVLRLEKLIGDKVFETDKDIALILFLFLHSLRLSVRLCISCQPVSLHVNISLLCSSLNSGTQIDAGCSKNVEINHVSNRKSLSKEQEDKKQIKTRKRSSAVIKDDESTPEKKKKLKVYRDYWVEYWDEATMRWICFDPFSGLLDSPENMENHTSSSIQYVICIDNNGGMRDVTERYASNFLSTKFRRNRVDKTWWYQTMRIFRGRNRVRERMETVALRDYLCSKPLPTNVADYKNHPLYVLKKDLLKFEAIYPEDQKPVGQIRGIDIYPRSAVHHLQGALNWIKEARSIKPNEKPYKIVKARPNIRVPEELREPRTLEIFGYWQTERYQPPEVIDGKIPRNEFGNIYLYKKCMLPKGCVHLRLEGLVSISRRLNIDCVPAVIGWEFHKGGNHPILDGCVVLSKHEKILRDAWCEEYERKCHAAVKKKKERVLKNWRRFIKGVLTLKRVHAKFLSGHVSEDRKIVNEEQLGSSGYAEEEQKPIGDCELVAAWPRANFDMPQSYVDQD